MAGKKIRVVKPRGSAAEAFAVAVDAELSELREMLLAKNRAYGDSALRPLRVFSKALPETGIRDRIDDKLKRIMTSAPGDQEDAVRDLQGYLILLRIAQKRGPRG